MNSLSPLEYDEKIIRKCPECDNFIPQASVYCPFCGIYLLEPVQIPDEEPDPPPSSRNMLSRIIMIALAVVVVKMALYFIILPQTTSLFGKKPNPDTMSTEMLTPTEVPTPTAAPAPTEVPTPTATPAPTEMPTPTATPTQIITSTPIPTNPPATETDLTVVKGIRDPSTNNDIYIPGATESSYLWPDANSRYYSESDLDGLTQGQVRYLINEIYAREGYTFKNDIWAEYFKKKTWYNATVSNEDFNANPRSYLNTYEYQNVEMINSYQVKHHYQEYG